MENMITNKCSADRHRQTENAYKHSSQHTVDFQSILDVETEKLDRQQERVNSKEQTERAAQTALAVSAMMESFQSRTGVADRTADEIVHHCLRKMELTGKSEEYILLLLPDELKQYCVRGVFNAKGVETLEERRATQNV